MNIENLKALVYGKETTPYQRALALSEFSKVVEALEKPTYTPADLDEFAEWIGNNKYYVPFYNPISESIVWAKNGTRDDYIITTQLREMWEKERKEATE